MRFLARDMANFLEAKLRRQMADQSKPKLTLYYKSSDRDYYAAANAITASIGGFTEENLLFLFSVSGDGWNENTASNERWRRYKQWRCENGEPGRLYDAPGHQFAPHEAKPLAEAIEFALQLGWDTLIAIEPGRQLLLLSFASR